MDSLYYGNLYTVDLRQQSRNIPYSLLYIAIAYKGHLHIAEISLHWITDTEVTTQLIQISP